MHIPEFSLKLYGLNELSLNFKGNFDESCGLLKEKIQSFVDTFVGQNLNDSLIYTMEMSIEEFLKMTVNNGYLKYSSVHVNEYGEGTWFYAERD